MLFNSFIFFIFLIIVLPLYYALPRQIKGIFLLLSSYFFYGYWDYRFVSLLIISTVIDFVVGRAIYTSTTQQNKTQWLVISIVTNLSILFIFKYYDFFISSFEPLAAIFGGKIDYLHLHIILPIGISFYTFQTMSYTIDIYRDKLKPTNSILDFAIFVSFFPQLVAGPIERANKLLPQIEKLPLPSVAQLEKGIILIVVGLFKKVMIGDAAGRYVDHIFYQPSAYKSAELIVALFLFSIQIYADFSGYSNMARGTAKLLGIELMKNFEQPYFSRNITEFWHRWHISLSSWLKDYLYISLGGNRKGISKTYRNLMLTMLLGGLWHGSSWNFIIWGTLHGIYLSIHKYVLGIKKITPVYKYNGIFSLFKFILNITLTYILVLFAWLFFRATDLSIVSIFFKKIIYWESSEFTSQFIIVGITFAFATLLIDFFEYHTGKHTFLLLLHNKTMMYAILFVVLSVSFLFMLVNNTSPFIYFQF